MGGNQWLKTILREIAYFNRGTFYDSLNFESLRRDLEKELEKDESKIVENFNIVSKLQKNKNR